MPKHPFSWLIVLLALTCGASVAQAQTGSDTDKIILVLDASGSMWGQIDGEAKITIARRVIGDLLDTLPAKVELGLTVYGHREKGNCDDIETLVVPGAQPRGAIRQAIAMIKPKGKTPLSKAVELAAEALKYEENKATVILVSDGIETCNYDPCDVGKHLEANGIDFTAHVIGFDLADDETRAQLQCLAENTGGRFLTADNAEELADALQQVSAAAPPAARIDAVFEATDGKGGPVIKNGLAWTLSDLETGAATVDGLEIGVLRMPVEAGAYKVVVKRTDGVSAEREVEIGADADNSFVLPLIVELPDASISASAEAAQGSALPVTWAGPNEDRDYISVAEAGSDGGVYINYTYTEKGSPLQLRMPPKPGEYEIRYIRSQDNEVLASATVTVVPVEVSVSAASEAPQGSAIPVTWVGPDEQRDYISVAEAGSDGGAYINYTYTEKGSPLQLRMPAKPGDYEIRYILSQDNKILASTTVKVTQVEVSVSAASEAPQGSAIPVTWVGPDEQRDYI
ncbi:Ca-activated chloride channel family protein, partial [Breoghania corrubedonensis]